MSTTSSSNDSNLPNAPGYDLPSPKLTSSNRNIESNFDSSSYEYAFYGNDDYPSNRFSQKKNKGGRPNEVTGLRVGVSDARDAILKRVEKAEKAGESKVLHLQTDLVVKLIEDYDKLRRDYEILAEDFDYEQRKSTLNSEKLEKYIEIANQTIDINDWCIEELDKRHEKIKLSRKELANDPGIREGLILEDNVKASNCSEICADTDKSYDASKKVPDQGDNENGGCRNEGRPDERGEENYGIGNSRTDYVVEGIKSGVGIGKNVEPESKTRGVANGRDGKIMWDMKSEGNNSQTWSDQVDEYLDKGGEEYWGNEKIDENGQDWKVETHNDKGDHKHDRGDKENKDGWGPRNKGDNRERINGYDEDKPLRNERQGGGSNRNHRGGGRNGNNRRR